MEVVIAFRLITGILYILQQKGLEKLHSTNYLRSYSLFYVIKICMYLPVYTCYKWPLGVLDLTGMSGCPLLCNCVVLASYLKTNCSLVIKTYYQKLAHVQFSANG